MSKHDSIASCLAKIYESKLESSKGPVNIVSKSPAGVNSMDKKLNLLNDKVDKLLNFQEDVLGRLETVYHGMDVLERGMDKLSSFHQTSYPLGLETEVDTKEDRKQIREDSHCSDLIWLLKKIHNDSLVHREKLDSLEKMVSTMDKVVEFVGNTLRNSKILDFILKGAVPWRKETLVEAKDSSAEREEKTKHVLVHKVPAGDATKPSALKDKERSQKTKVESTHRRSARETSKLGSETDVLNVVAERSAEKGTCSAPRDEHGQAVSNQATDQSTRQEEPCIQGAVSEESWSPALSHDPSSLTSPEPQSAGPVQLVSDSTCTQIPISEMTKQSPGSNIEDCSTLGKPHDNSKAKSILQKTDNIITEEKLPSQTLTTSKIQASTIKKTKRGKSKESSEKMPSTQQTTSDTGWRETDNMKNVHIEKQSPTQDVNEVMKIKKAELVDKEPGTTQAEGCTSPTPSVEAPSLHVIDDGPPPPAPFNHRIVSLKQAILTSCYTVCQHEVLGGGRFGQVHKCVEITTGLRLAAKIVKVKGSKDRDEVKNEINVMNQLNHVNLIQLYDAFECKNDLTLIMEYLDGGELFDRITDENYNLTELDAIMFTKQICEGVYYLHQQYILHLDLKPENILCVSRTGNQIKIIDFGLARRYKPREKLRVNFGTPEFLAPEVVNYDFVSFPTDMWSVGVITYMLLSGLSPFLGESDAETMNYIVNCNWDFDSETFEQVSDESKDFISRLLLKEKSCRLSAAQCLKHEWLASLPSKAKKYKVRLKSQLLLQRYLAQKKWKKHFYVVAAANRLKKFQLLSLKPS
ncbi:myosin light chain kinase 3 [Pelobates cultripes]|uniref:Myosin light chain kinase 3 n=2 Tax=Pelobates cultripes TaxID=61616 RepID=A0AAD1TD95_PELCU|nr:myosin light chain kinase 3 [Pelobates cultripes]